MYQLWVRWRSSLDWKMEKMSNDLQNLRDFAEENKAGLAEYVVVTCNVIRF